ncbi:Styryl dye vacuolar localization protein 3 [Wickerhamomyces ciferrii]|uniref:Styryl dye vacuolar localization protein 3 n=1 Tax=Wickerhamomyces ciferrii (strain ATCC 14091 / BCRC 22168 / CBS 111 / JCM 3599 / NBRC 0793 / NRRL Y-1031 F-60-10) TaxID=1206466 RepID=K0KI00_WICCF|nr:Styryl dye vacuolar localization protein 3 [Wickerhamomyces ciferrii]CCH41039.1 Styryl dye vacuolar localization protein 3 [Wickerhamomyces ciferrii]
MSSRLNVLSVGANPNLLYYSWKLNNTGKFKFHIFNDELDSSLPITLSNEEGFNTFQPDVIYSRFDQFSLQTKFDIIFLSSKSLQDISNLSTNLSPFLNSNTIIIVESTGFVNLEPFLKNCLPSKSSASIISILTNLDIRKVDQNQYLILPNTSGEIILGESSTKQQKFNSTTFKNLSIIAKIFQSSTNEKIILKNTYLEFLTEEWKIAIPQICFNPLLILFEESQPSGLSNQILAKPLLSGLVTELITVAKTMGCKLPHGYDNESNFLRNWIDQYPNSTSTSQIKFLQSPRFFYDFFHKNNLDIDMLLLQPILLADDYGIKTPYLEFLYATICQFDKFNNSKEEESIFFNRSISNSKNLEFEKLIKSNESLSQKLISKDDELSQLNSKLLKLSQSNEKFNKDKDLQHSTILSQFDSLKQQHQVLQQQLQQRDLKFQQLENQHRSLQQQQQVQQQQQQIQQIPQQIPPQIPQQIPQEQNDRSIQPPQESPIQQRNTEQFKHSVEGTPDLRDLTDVALLSQSLESPVKYRQAPQSQVPTIPQASESDTLNGGVIQVNGSTNQLSNGNNNGGLQSPQVVPQLHLSAKEIELQKKEQLLQSRELELNKKLQKLNRYPGGPQGPQGPPQQNGHQQQSSIYSNNGPSRHPHQHSQHHHQHPQHPQQVIPGPNGLQQFPQNPHLVNGLPNNHNQGPVGPQGLGPQGIPTGLGQQHQQQQLQGPGGIIPQQQPQPQQRRVSTMPVLDSNDMFNNPQFKKTSRKNRKSSFPLVTPGIDNNYGGMPLQTNLDSRFRNQYQQPTTPTNGHQIYRPNPTKAVTSPTIPTTSQFQQPQPRPQAPQQVPQTDQLQTNPYTSQSLSNSNSQNNSNSNSSNELNSTGQFNNLSISNEEPKPLGIVGNNPQNNQIKEEKKRKRDYLEKNKNFLVVVICFNIKLICIL